MVILGAKKPMALGDRRCPLCELQFAPHHGNEQHEPVEVQP